MDKQIIIEELLAILEQNDVEIRTEMMGGGGGGLCKIKDKYTFFVDTQAPTAEAASICAQAVAKIVDIENIYIKPEVRDFIQKNKPEGSGEGVK